jgi:hypothetical protein
MWSAGFGSGRGSNLREDPDLLRGLMVDDDPWHMPDNHASKADLIPLDPETGYLTEPEAA